MSWRCTVCNRVFTRRGSANVHAQGAHDLSPTQAKARVVDDAAPANAPPASSSSSPAANQSAPPPAASAKEDDWWD